ncbi:MAG: Hpt domain-containing protein, partial [Bacteroidota bacterium]
LDYLELMSDGDPEMKAVMLEMLLSELPEELKKMQDLFSTTNWKELSSVSHKMKSTLAFVGNDPMTEANKQIETLTKNGPEVSQVESQLNILVEMCPKVIAELQVEQRKTA